MFMIEKIRELKSKILEEAPEYWEDFQVWFVEQTLYKRRAFIHKWAREVAVWLSVLLIIIMFFRGCSPIPIDQHNITYNIVESAEQVAVEERVEVDLGKAIRQVIETECERQNVDINLVYAIIYSDDVADGTPRYGIMRIHPDLLSKYDAMMGKGPGVVESIYSNAVAGITRLNWALKNNSTIEGALMAYIYTKPIAQEMWKEGVSTTNWVESVKENMR